MALPKIGSNRSDDGGAGISTGHKRAGESTYIELLLALRDELDDIRTKYNAVLVKLDADAGVTDTDYASGNALASATFEK